MGGGEKKETIKAPFGGRVLEKKSGEFSRGVLKRGSAKQSYLLTVAV